MDERVLLNGTGDRLGVSVPFSDSPGIGQKPPRKRSPKVKPIPPPEANRPPVVPTSPQGADALLLWARSGVGLTVALSALLNGWANAEQARPGMGWAGWGLGICVPALVLILARVSGGAYLRGRRGLGACGGFVCVGLLALSVRHCAHTFSALTGADTVSAVLWAIGVDAGLVVCELATIGRRGK